MNDHERRWTASLAQNANLASALSVHYGRNVPVAALDAAMATTIRNLNLKRTRSRRYRSWRVLSFALPSAAALVAAAALLIASILQPQNVTPISAQILLTKASFASLPRSGHATVYRFQVQIRCPRVFRCPKAKLQLWTVNVGGFYIYSGSLRLNGAGPVSSGIITNGNGFAIPTAHGVWLGPHGRSGGRPDNSRHMRQWLRQHTHHSWPYDAYKSAVMVGLEDPVLLRQLVVRRPVGAPYPAPERGAFNGVSVWVLRLPFGFGMYATHARMLIDARTYLLRGLRMSVCVRWAVMSGEVPSCQKYTTMRLSLQTWTRLPLCSVPRSHYAFFFQKSASSQDLWIQGVLRKPPPMPECSR
jgi:hypothetical protein